VGVLPIAYIGFLVMGVIKLKGFVDDWARDIDKKVSTMEYVLQLGGLMMIS
jgi:hypothetical protein